jgi:hypothetical protein
MRIDQDIRIDERRTAHGVHLGQLELCRPGETPDQVRSLLAARHVHRLLPHLRVSRFDEPGDR